MIWSSYHNTNHIIRVIWLWFRGVISFNEIKGSILISRKRFIFVKEQKLSFMNELQEKVILPLQMVMVSL